MTRGVGAIAALDRAGGARRETFLRGVQATRVRDAKMASIANGALGIINDKTIRAPVPSGRTVRKITAITPTKIVESPPIIAVPPPQITWDGIYTAPKPTAPVVPPPPPPVVVESPPIIPIPVPVPGEPIMTGKPVKVDPTPGTGTVMPTGGPGQVTPIDPVDINLDPIPETKPADNTMRNVAIVGGVALAVYLMFGR